jgi:hypothetical protein
VVISVLASAQSADATQAGMPTATPVPTLAPQVAPPPSTQLPPLTAGAAKQMLSEFQRAQSSEMKALDHRNKMELKELKAAHAARQKEWERKEKDARHKFFNEHPDGPVRRDYIHDFIARHSDLLQILSDEKTQRIHELEIRYNSVRDDQVTRLKEFQDSLKRGVRPPANLWPTSG